MSKFSIPVYGQVLTDSQLLLQKLKALIVEKKLPSNLVAALKELLQSEELNSIFGIREKEKLQMIVATTY